MREAETLLALPMGTERIAARLALRDDMLRLRLEAKRASDRSKFGDALARFGGGSLLTATLLLLL